MREPLSLNARRMGGTRDRLGHTLVRIRARDRFAAVDATVAEMAVDRRGRVERPRSKRARNCSSACAKHRSEALYMDSLVVQPEAVQQRSRLSCSPIQPTLGIEPFEHIVL